MGPQPSSRGNHLQHQLPVGVVSNESLQWGRNLPVAEISTATHGLAKPDRRIVASMGPQPSSRGNLFGYANGSRIENIMGFNGAATFQSRKSHPPICGASSSYLLQWGRNLPVAEICRYSRGIARRLLEHASMGPQPSSRGNRTNPSCNVACAERASMGPQPSSRGNSAPEKLEQVCRICGFNGAATFQSRKLERAGRFPLATIRDCFNGAATFQSRKWDSPRHRLNLASRRASMGPQPSSRGNPAVHHDNRLHYRQRFNGAATFQSRKFSPALICPVSRSLASMGPQPSSRGNLHESENH